MDWQKNLCRYSWSPDDVSEWLWWSPDVSSSATMRLTFVVWVKCLNNIHVPLRMNFNDFGDPLTFPLAPPSGQILNASNTLVGKHKLQKFLHFSLIVALIFCVIFGGFLFVKSFPKTFSGLCILEKLLLSHVHDVSPLGRVLSVHKTSKHSHWVLEKRIFHL